MRKPELVQSVILCGLVEEMFLISHFPSSFMLGSYDDDDGAQLYMIDPSGVSYVSVSKIFPSWCKFPFKSS